MFNPFEDILTRLVRVEALLLELQSITILPAPANKQLGGVELAMQITGLAQSTIYNLVCAGSIPHMKRGRKLYFSRAELEAWIMDGKHQTLQELETEVARHLSDKPDQKEESQSATSTR
ncbi:helix-turn-helix domain-containing protein [Cytophagaceae bacterium YF14B1]|uniref:Helix-turn-helix domain-containing protein n=1 Tax=Xanthocytophaga flava TaxID=3048013 RepID=A0AAE3QXK6_9BACT|nr:helix-turn-helix domain-containing protein [Xanthocytophaga flavus]MDJ1484343.1 helix-turn-helix domain-containing protein [Xanthocytophaga flavus]